MGSSMEKKCREESCAPAVGGADRIPTGHVRESGSFLSDHGATSGPRLDENVVCADLLHTPSSMFSVKKTNQVTR